MKILAEAGVEPEHDGKLLLRKRKTAGKSACNLAAVGSPFIPVPPARSATHSVAGGRHGAFPGRARAGAGEAE